MIDLDAIEKECQELIADGLGFLPVKSCGSAHCVIELIEMVKLERQRNLKIRCSLHNAAASAFFYGDKELANAIKADLNCEQ